jgi:DNA-binding MarR family transcriptional regulator
MVDGMKESFHDSSAAATGERRVVEDVDAVRAMANPHRVAILYYLLSGPARTATECAAEVGGTASACSYHLRELERFGLVERVESTGDARARPWRAAAVGFSISAGLLEDSPAGRAAEIALTRAELVENHRLIKRFLDAGNSVDPEWRSVSDFHTFELVVSPAELNELNNKIGELLRTYRAPTRADAPADAKAVHVIYQAFPRLPASQ